MTGKPVEEPAIDSKERKLQFRNVSDDYDAINAIAHRWWVPQFNAPTLTWHRAFWVRDIYERIEPHNNDIKEMNKKRSPPAKILPPSDYVKYRLDQAIRSFYFGLSNKGTPVEIEPCFERVVKDKGGLPFKDYEGHNIKENDIYLFSEVVSKEDITKRVDDTLWTQRERDIKQQIMQQSEGRVVMMRFSAYHMRWVVRVELRSEYFCISTFAEFRDDNNVSDDLHYSKIDVTGFQAMYNLLVARFSGQKASMPAEVGRYFYNTFWEKFLHDVLKMADKSRIFQTRVFRNVFADFRGMILSNETCRNVEISNENDVKNGTWGYNVDDKLREVLHDATKNEISASLAIRNRVLYMSSLGAQPTKEMFDEPVPLEVVVYIQQGKPTGGVRPVNKWQLGRFIDRLHLIGTVRLAALKNYPALVNVGEALSEFDAKVGIARGAVTGNEKKAEEAIKGAHEAFNEITKMFNKATRTNSGVLYRIERSRYYTTQFHKNIESLKLQTIEGYQKHDKFVERRLGPTYDFIDRLGARYERAANSLSTLDQHFLSLKTNELQEDTRKIHLGGEYALLAVLLPYYMISNFSGVINETATPLLTMLVWIMFIGWLTFRVSEKSENIEVRKNKLGIAVAAGLVLLMLSGLVATFHDSLPLHLPAIRSADVKARQEEKEEKWLEGRVTLQEDIRDRQVDILKVQRDVLSVQDEMLKMQKAEQEKRERALPYFLQHDSRRHVQ